MAAASTFDRNSSPVPPSTERLSDLRWDGRSLWDLFAGRMADDPEATALIDCEERVWTRKQLGALAVRIGEEFASTGFRPGDRVLLAASKDAACLASALAISARGGVICPVSKANRAADLGALRQRLGHSIEIRSRGMQDVEMLRAPEAPVCIGRHPEEALVGFTSGSTGHPRGVVHRAAALNYATATCRLIANLSDEDAILGIMPMDSAAGFTFTAHFALSLGHPLVLVDPWDPVEALCLAERYQCGWTTGVPTHLLMMVEAARSNRWSGSLRLKAMAVGGSAITAELIQDTETWLGFRPLRMFGMSECIGHCSTHPDDSADRRLHWDGTPYPGTEVEAFSANGERLPRGERGQAGVRGPSLFLGYAEKLGEGLETFTEDGFYLTGDEIVRDREGFVKVVGRIKDIIIRGGFNVYPPDVEAHISLIPSIAQVAVIGVPDPQMGERVCAVVTVRDGSAAPTLEDIAAHLTARGVYKRTWPEYLIVVPSLPTLAGGKIDKRAIRVTAVADLALDSSASPGSEHTAELHQS